MSEQRVASRHYVVSHYWDAKIGHAYYRNQFHLPDHDAVVSYDCVIADALKRAGVADGDEIEIIVRKTGRRPFGDRRMVLVEPHTYRREGGRS